MRTSRAWAGERTPPVAVVVTCEHASRRVPPALRERLAPARGALAGHRGFDRGAAALARRVARVLHAPLVVGTVSRLVVDLNRSPTNPAVFSAWTRGYDRAGRQALLARHHAPHWQAVDRVVTAGLTAAACGVVHVAVHTFTPRVGGRARQVDVGLLYDPARRREADLCRRWRAILGERVPWVRVRMNQPYRGVSDGLATALRRRLQSERYVGIELEVSQRLLRTRRAPAVRRALAHGLAAVLAEWADGARPDGRRRRSPASATAAACASAAGRRDRRTRRRSRD